MSVLFMGLTNFNMPIDHWDVSNVIYMDEMFAHAESFDQPIGGWDVGNVMSMQGMFYNALSFNQPIGDWNVGRVTNMGQMFAGAESFNQPIGGWNVSNVNNMWEMFTGARSFNQPIGDWNVGRVTDMESMFGSTSMFDDGAISFSQPGIAKWDRLLRTPLSRVDGMFADAPRAEAAYRAGKASMGRQTGRRRAALRASLNARGIPDDVVDKILYKAGVMQLRGLKDDEFRGKGTRLDRVRRRNQQQHSMLLRTGYYL